MGEFDVKRLKVLIAAYACRPDKGSEPGVGWNIAQELVKHHDVWVLTRPNNRPSIEAELALHPIPGLHFVYSDLPGWLRWWKQERWEVHLHYYLWQIEAYFTARNLHREINFDLVHHVTYGRYCAPSFLALMPIPFIWGPVGGGESAPYSFWPDFGFRGQVYETVRNLSRWIGERDPLVGFTARRCAVAIVATTETSARLSALGAKRIETITGQTGINEEELIQLKKLASSSAQRPIRFISLGRLLHWKGFHIGLRAFAQADLKDSEYWIIGEGRERQRLERLAEELGISDRLRFLGELSREQALSTLGECDALVHPSLHDFSPTVCLEAMAAGKPVLCLDLGGPAVQITAETGFKIKAHEPEQAVRDMAAAMKTLANDSQLRERMGEAGQNRVSEFYGWKTKRQFFVQLYEQVMKE